MKLKVESALAGYRPRRYWARRFVKRSAVCILVYQGERTELLMIRRAEREGDPWSGHMAFPGGRYDKTLDRSIRSTALRETQEEIGVCPEVAGQPLARLSDVVTPTHVRRPVMVVTPYIYVVQEKPLVNPNEEVAEVIWVPLDYLATTDNRQQMTWNYKGVPLSLPCYHYQGRTIWGLSLKMIDELLALTEREE